MIASLHFRVCSKLCFVMLHPHASKTSFTAITSNPWTCAAATTTGRPCSSCVASIDCHLIALLGFHHIPFPSRHVMLSSRHDR